MAEFLSFVIIATVLLGAIPAAIAKKKGRSFMLWWLFGTTLFIIALPTAILVGEGDSEEAGIGTKIGAVFSFLFIGFLFVSAVAIPKDGDLIIRSDQNIVSYDEYKIISNDMSYQKVVEVIGAEGKELSRNRIEGVPGVMSSIETVMYSWDNADFSGMNVTFQNGRVVQKSQFGLE
jgi:hypothetical protein